MSYHQQQYQSEFSHQEQGSYGSNSAIDPQLLQHENPNNCCDLAPALPLDQYKLNVDNNPQIIRKRPQEKVRQVQEVSVRYLKPPQAPRAGDIIIRELPGKQVAPAPALVKREQAPRPQDPAPLVVREAPPQAPCPLPGKTITVPGKNIPPPARKVIIERLAPQPPKPQNIHVERWLAYGPQTQKVIYQPAKPACVIPDPKNVIIQWEAPEVEVRKEVKNLGVVEANLQEYVSRHGSSLVRADALPEVARQVSNQHGVQLAANTKASESIRLEGDVHALRLVNLEQNGLGYLRNQVGGQAGSVSDAVHHSAAAGASAQSWSGEASYQAQSSSGGCAGSATYSQSSQYSAQQGGHYAASNQGAVRLEGDVQALRLINLEQNGLGHLRNGL